MWTTVHSPQYAEAGVCAVGEATEAEALASLKVSQNKSKVLHTHSIPYSEQMWEANIKKQLARMVFVWALNIYSFV